MRRNLALTIALTAFAAALGGGLASAQQLLEGSNVNVPGANLPPVQLPDCANGIDDDGDGLIDLADPDCASSGGTSESPPPAPPGGGGGGGGGGGAGGGGAGGGGGGGGG
ncbi:MAG: hypothetical protein AABM29_09900, partial [Actinomycetota bacterium]